VRTRGHYLSLLSIPLCFGRRRRAFAPTFISSAVGILCVWKVQVPISTPLRTPLRFFLEDHASPSSSPSDDLLWRDFCARQVSFCLTCNSSQSFKFANVPLGVLLAQHLLPTGSAHIRQLVPALPGGAASFPRPLCCSCFVSVRRRLPSSGFVSSACPAGVDRVAPVLTLRPRCPVRTFAPLRLGFPASFPATTPS